MYSVRLISTYSIKFQTSPNLSHSTLVSDCGKANPDKADKADKANKAAAARPCLGARYNVSCNESYKLSSLSPPKH